MKTTLCLSFLFCVLALGACIQTAPNVKVSIKLQPPPPPPPVPMPFGPEADLKYLKSLVGDTVITQGKVYGHKNAGDTTFVYMGAPYPDQQLLVLITGDGRKAFVNMDNKLIYVAGCIAKRNGIIQMIVSDSDHLGFNYLYRKQKVK